MKHRVVLCTGGFDPLHSGHIEYLRCAKALGDTLIVGLNSDDWLSRKKGQEFLPFYEREQIVSNLRMVDNVIMFDDHDDTAIEAIIKTKRFYQLADVIFANGGDRTADNIPEEEYFLQDDWITFKYGVGGDDKKNSSSWLLKNWTDKKTDRNWGYYKVLHEVMNKGGHTKVKELTVEPGNSLSMQKHLHRNELWFVAEGNATLQTVSDNSMFPEDVRQFKQYDFVTIKENEWHQLINETEKPLKIVEIQYGEFCNEEDIIRL